LATPTAGPDWARALGCSRRVVTFAAAPSGAVEPPPGLRVARRLGVVPRDRGRSPVGPSQWKCLLMPEEEHTQLASLEFGSRLLSLRRGDRDFVYPPPREGETSLSPSLSLTGQAWTALNRRTSDRAGSVPLSLETVLHLVSQAFCSGEHCTTNWTVKRPHRLSAVRQHRCYYSRCVRSHSRF
jgi:hypothetical protein